MLENFALALSDSICFRTLKLLLNLFAFKNFWVFRSGQVMTLLILPPSTTKLLCSMLYALRRDYTCEFRTKSEIPRPPGHLRKCLVPWTMENAHLRRPTCPRDPLSRGRSKRNVPRQGLLLYTSLVGGTFCVVLIPLFMTNTQYRAVWRGDKGMLQKGLL